MGAMEFLEGEAKQVAIEVVAEEEKKRRHLVIALSGAHAYGFPSPDSDLDLKAVHIASTRELLGLSEVSKKGRTTFDRLEFIREVEIDYTSNELHAAIAGLVAGNGNFLERLAGKLLCYEMPERAELAELCIGSGEKKQGLLSRRFHRHYRGFAHSQRLRFEEAEKPSAKKLLYVLRTALTGRHLLRTGELIVDLRETAPIYGVDGVEELIAAKREGERAVLASSQCERWQPVLDGLFAALDEACDASPLPEEADSDVLQAVEDWLLDRRKEYW